MTVTTLKNDLRAGLRAESASTAAAAPAVDRLHLDQQLCFPLYAASNLLTRLYGPELKKLGLTYPQYLVMMALWQHAPCLVSDLGRLLHLDSGTLTPLLKRLQQAGFVERRRDADDERKVVISLSAAGAALRTQARAVPEAMLCRLAMEPTQMLRLREDLQALVKHLQQLA